MIENLLTAFLILWSINVNIKKHQIKIRGISLDVVRKDIKNLHIGVYPPNGRVRVAVPLHLDDEAVRLAVISRLAWLRKHITKFKQQHRQSQREMVSGECHYFQGRSYRLDVIEHNSPPLVKLQNHTKIEMRVRPGASREKREALLHQWYRQELKKQVPKLITKWEPKIGVKVAEFGIKKMKTRWGTCNINARRIWLNLELAKKPVQCLEYIVVHEMAHIIERLHNDSFRELMDKLMPQWRMHQKILNQAPLDHETWGY